MLLHQILLMISLLTNQPDVVDLSLLFASFQTEYHETLFLVSKFAMHYDMLSHGMLSRNIITRLAFPYKMRNLLVTVFPLISAPGAHLKTN